MDNLRKSPNRAIHSGNKIFGLCLIMSLSVSAWAQPPLVKVKKNGKQPVYQNDFAALGRYRKANNALKAPAAGENRVVFMGDSIIDNWQLAKCFPGKRYIGRGISGQTTTQMLARFHQDVIELHPRAVVILGGTNDIAGGTDMTRLEDIEANCASMADIARANGVRVVFASILPVHNYTPSAKFNFSARPLGKIRTFNQWLKKYCASTGCVYLDYFSVMVDAKGMLRAKFSDDGLHPNDFGHQLIAKTISRKLKTIIAYNYLSAADR